MIYGALIRRLPYDLWCSNPQISSENMVL